MARMQIEMSTNPNLPSRRSFLAAGVAAGLAATATTAAAIQDQADPPRAADPAFELGELSIADLQEGMKSGKFTARSIAEMYLARIEAVDSQDGGLGSVIELNPDALSLADALDRERQEKGPRGPLHGIPVMIKDNIDTADRMATTAGSLALVGSKPPGDASLVKQLRQAGGLLLAKTNLSEWANIRCSYSTSGWSGRGGLTRNPYALDRNPCGSSSGSGVAVSANLCAIAIGTETDGSVVCPASANGIVGVKPTVGLVSRTGIVPISHSQDTAGPMARTVRDAAILLGVLAGVDPEDSATAHADRKAEADYTQFLDPGGLKDARIGVARNHFDFNDRVEAMTDVVLDALKQGGATLIDVDISSIDEAGGAETTVFQYELKADMSAYLARLGPDAPVKSLADIIEFNDRNRQQEMPFFGQDFFLESEEKGPLTSYEYIEALAKCRRLTRTEGIDAVMDKEKLDALVAPTLGPACMTDLVNGDRWLGGSTSAAAISGYPSITVPGGFVFGLPVGISFFGRAWSEPTLLRLAYAFEQATKFRAPPKLLETADLSAAS